MGALVQLDTYRERIAERSAALTAGRDPGAWVLEELQRELFNEAVAHAERAKRTIEQKAPEAAARELRAASSAIQDLYKRMPVAAMLSLVKDLHARRERLLAPQVRSGAA